MTLKEEILSLIKKGKKKRKKFVKIRDEESAEESSFDLGEANHMFDGKTEINEWYIKKLEDIAKQYSHQY